MKWAFLAKNKRFLFEAGFTPLETRQYECRRARRRVLSLTGFTLIELLVVISIISLLSSAIFASVNRARDRGRFGVLLSNVQALKLAPELYFDDMGFYPPDVGRGWDPGFMQPLPFNPDTGASDIPSCSWCPAGWDAIATARWKGPYLSAWPRSTPWGGKYDYNYWPAGASRYGCNVPPGFYVGAQRDYAELNPISPTVEQMFIDAGLDGDKCLNGEVQVLVFPL